MQDVPTQPEETPKRVAKTPGPESKKRPACSAPPSTVQKKARPTPTSEAIMGLSETVKTIGESFMQTFSRRARISTKTGSNADGFTTHTCSEDCCNQTGAASGDLDDTNADG